MYPKKIIVVSHTIDFKSLRTILDDAIKDNTLVKVRITSDNPWDFSGLITLKSRAMLQTINNEKDNLTYIDYYGRILDRQKVG